MQAVFQIKFPKKGVSWLLENTDIHHNGTADDFIVHLVFHQLEVISCY